MSKDRKALIVFYGITFTVSIAVSILYVVTKIELLVMLLMWVPGITGIICGKRFFGKEKDLGVKKKVKPLYIILAMLIPVLYLVPSYLIAWKLTGDPTSGLSLIVQSYTGSTDISGPVFVAVSFIPMVLISALSAAGEELGWRGFAYPVLSREFGPVKGVIINGFLWALWHFPIIIGGVYQSDVNIVYGLISFTVCIMAIAVVCCASRDLSGSVIPTVLIHATHNAVDQVYLQPLSTNAKVPYYAGEQGIITMILIAVIAAAVIAKWKTQRSRI